MKRLRAPSGLALLCVAAQVSCASPEDPGDLGDPASRGARAPACSRHEGEPVVEIVRSSTFAGIAADTYARTWNDDLIGTISNSNFYRFWDGTCGSYKVPVRIVAPKAQACGRGNLARVGLVELIHPNYIGYLPPGEAEGVTQAWNDPVYDPLLDHGFHEAWANLREWFLFGEPARGGGGVVYMGFQANNFGGELDYIAGLPENGGMGLHLDRPQDYAIVYRDASKWLREAKTPLNFVSDDRDDLCEVSDVVAFGYSSTSVDLKAVIANPHHLNSTWGSADAIFSRGRVFDGVLMGGFFGELERDGETFEMCVDVTSGDSAATAPCSGPADRSEGPMVLVQSETDVQMFNPTTSRPRPFLLPLERDYYKVHEVNSASHIDESYYSYAVVNEYFGDDPSQTRQNPLDRSPVFRADLVSLVAKIRQGTPLPPSKYMKALPPVSAYGLGIVALEGSTGNGSGGVELPQAAAPLGLYRGADCHNAYSPEPDVVDPYHYERWPNGSGDLRTLHALYVLESSPGLSPGELCVAAWGIEGMFTSYGEVDEALGTSFCADLYPTRRAYSKRVAAAADRLVAQRYLLPQDRDGVVAAAEAAADEFPDCVPAR